MTGNKIRESYIDFFKKKGHQVVPSAPLVPENDPTTLLNGSGMQPLLNYFLGEIHPLGSRIVDSQKCFRAEDIEEIGDNRHTTFFEMLGNWSFGDYFKKEQIPWVYEYLTKTANLDPSKLYVTVFEGSKDVERDVETIELWQELFHSDKDAKTGLTGFDSKVKVYEYGVEKNWWSRSGTPSEMPIGEPGGTTSEIFYLFDQVEHDAKYGEVCHPNCDCGRFLEIGNSVFMEYQKTEGDKLQLLPEKNIDFGGGLERIAAASNNDPDVFATDLFWPLIENLQQVSERKYSDENKGKMRVVADHLRGAVMIMSELVPPANKEQGYIVRRLLRRSIVAADNLGINKNILAEMVPFVVNYFESTYGEVKTNQAQIQEWVDEEEQKFKKVVKQGKKKLNKQLDAQESVDIDQLVLIMFDLFQSHGLPLELSQELARKRLVEFMVSDDELREKFIEMKMKHADASRSSAKGMFKGGLADSSEEIIKFHTTTHLLHQSLRDVLGDEVRQMGSNITAERLRFDFKFSRKMTEEEKLEVEKIVNQKIEDDLVVTKTEEDRDEAVKMGALAFFKETYPERVSVYTIGNDSSANWYSKELCGGPHVSSTGEIGTVTIKKEQAVGAGVRRIYMTLAEAV